MLLLELHIDRESKDSKIDFRPFFILLRFMGFPWMLPWSIFRPYFRTLLLLYQVNYIYFYFKTFGEDIINPDDEV